MRDKDIAILNFLNNCPQRSFLSWESGWEWMSDLTSEHDIKTWVRINVAKQEIWCTNGEGSSNTYPFKPTQRFIEYWLNRK